MASTRFMKEPGSAAYPPVRMEDVKLFWAMEKAPSHEVLGTITFRGDAILMKKDDVLFAFLRQKAAALGANGIILDSGRDPGTVARAFSEIVPIPGLVHREKTVIAIRYKEELQ